jgi:hypothetical protein
VLCLVFCTQKMYWAMHSLADTIPTFSTIWQFSSNWVITEVLVCPSYALREFIALVWCLSWHKSFLHPCLDHDVTLPPEHWLSSFQLAGSAFEVTWNASVTPHSATNSHLSVFLFCTCFIVLDKN